MSSIKAVQDTLCDPDDLPALPAVAARILDKIKDPETPMQQLADILATDPSLSAKVLNVVNSSYFGLPRTITNLSHAVSLLGEDSLKYIALSFSLIKLFDRHKNKFDYGLFWRHSLSVALACRFIADSLEWPDTEDMYFLGLVHNIGILALFHSHPKQYFMVLEEIKQQGSEFHVAENTVFGCNHMQVGAFLLNQWQLPEAFSLPVRHHHQPEKSNATDPKILTRTRILQIAVEISHFMHYEEKALHLALIEELLKTYDFAGRITIESALKKIQEQLEPLLPLFDLEANLNVDYVELLTESKKELVHLSFDLNRKIRQQQQTIEALSALAMQDGLTQISNYQSFQEALETEISGTQRYKYQSVLALADLDSFKAINDAYGHPAGDHVLQTVSRFFAENIRKSDMVARYGGEEFVFILSRTDLENGFKIVDRLREELAGMTIDYNGTPISLTMSVGVTMFSWENPAGKKELIRQADAAMYTAKNAGRNRSMCYQPNSL